MLTNYQKKKATLGETELGKINVSEILSIHQIRESKLLFIHTRYGLMLEDVSNLA